MVLLLFTGPALRSQQEPTISVDVKVVNLLASVHDKHGAIVRYLGKDDFVLEEDGHPQDIRYFAHESDLPLTLGLLVDTSLSQRRVLDQERSASYSFLDRMLRDFRSGRLALLQERSSSRYEFSFRFHVVGPFA